MGHVNCRPFNMYNAAGIVRSSNFDQIKLRRWSWRTDRRHHCKKLGRIDRPDGNYAHLWSLCSFSKTIYSCYCGNQQDHLYHSYIFFWSNLFRFWSENSSDRWFDHDHSIYFVPDCCPFNSCALARSGVESYKWNGSAAIPIRNFSMILILPHYVW